MSGRLRVLAPAAECVFECHGEAVKKISLLLADVDGTLVTRDKVLTERALKAVHSLHDNGIRFAITSGRPPRGMAMLIAPLRSEERRVGKEGRSRGWPYH